MREDIIRAIPLTTNVSVVIYTCDRCKETVEVGADHHLMLTPHPAESWSVLERLYGGDDYTIRGRKHFCGSCREEIFG